MTGTNLVHVPYQTVGQAVQDLLSGATQAMFLASSSALGHIEAKRLRALGWTSAERGSLVADLPTLAEAGLAGYETSLWSGITAPKGLPDAIRDKLSAAITAAVRSDAVAQAFRKIGIEPFPSESPQFGAYMAAESAKWGPIIEKTGLGN
jgi:tripartite-type tricarboxylate transporter receptor subunit TctC